MPFQIRPETPADSESIAAVTRAAFLNAAHTDHSEEFIVAGLRAAGALTVSLVAEVSGQVVGHVALSPVSISDGAAGWFGLGPISVLPAFQNQGLGAALMQAALQQLAQLAQLGAAGCVLLGDPAYYRRFGFECHAGLVLQGVPPEYFMALAFKGAVPSGAVSYHPAFAATA